jgi:RNA polymerase sigma factor (TIGR02999 family)
MGATAFSIRPREPVQITKLLSRLETGDPDAMDLVIPLVYDELKKIARAHLRREAGAGPFETTVLVHEAFLRLAGGRHPSYENRAHFYGIASRLMRQVLVDAARARAADKRSAVQEIPLTNLPDWAPPPNRDALAIDGALQELEKTDPLLVRLIEMKFFGGMTAEESSLALSIPIHTVRRGLRLAQAWLRKELAVAKIDLLKGEQ